MRHTPCGEIWNVKRGDSFARLSLLLWRPQLCRRLIARLPSAVIETHHLGAGVQGNGATPHTYQRWYQRRCAEFGALIDIEYY